MSLKAAMDQVDMAIIDLTSEEVEVGCALFHLRTVREVLKALFSELYPDHPSSNKLDRPPPVV